MLNYHNAHLQAGENPHGVRPYAAQHCFLVHVETGMVGDLLVGVYFLLILFILADYLIFLQKFLPSVRFPVLQHDRSNVWLHHDGAPPHYSRCVVNI